MDHLDEQRHWIQRALRLWAEFPSQQERRPLALLDTGVTASGFPSDASKLAFITGRIEAAAGFPPEILQVMRSHLRGVGDFEGPPLMVRTANRATTTFCTDRGRREFPAWRVQASRCARAPRGRNTPRGHRDTQRAPRQSGTAR